MKTRFLCASALGVMVLIAPALALTAQQRDAKLDHIADLIRDHYVYKDKALKIAEAVRALKSDPALAATTDEGQLATLLSEKLSPYDRHFHVTWRAPSPSQQQAAAAPDLAAEEAFMRQVNYGFDEVKRLPGNIGYLRFSFFADFDTALTGKKTPEARKTAEAALAFMANCDAVIFDLRQNGGGSPAMIDLLLSPFFKDKVLLNRFYQREGDRTEEFYTLTNYTGPKRSDVPLFVLISGRTASAAEEFAYDVQTQKRGTLIGDVTYGGANPGDFVDAGDGFAIFISTGAAINPITGTNWEAVGVKPDIAVPQDQAMSRANIEALKAILAKPAAGRDYTAQRWALEQEEALLHPPKPQALEPFAGQYMARSVELKDGALYFVRDRAPQVKLVPLGPDLFGGEGVPDRRFQFARDAQGKVERLTVRDASGGSTVFTRTTP